METDWAVQSVEPWGLSAPGRYDDNHSTQRLDTVSTSVTTYFTDWMTSEQQCSLTVALDFFDNFFFFFVVSFISILVVYKITKVK